MNFFNKLTIKVRMILSFAFMLALFVLFGLIFVDRIGVLSGLTQTLYEHPLQVSNAALSASLEVSKIDRNMKGLILAQTAEERNDVVRAIREAEQKVYLQLDIVREWILGEEGKELEKKARKAFSDWQESRDEVIGLVADGYTKAAAFITQKKEESQVNLLERRMRALTTYARKKADGFMQEAQNVKDHILMNILGFLLLATLLSLVISYGVASSILSNVSLLKETMAKITETGELCNATLEGENELTEMSHHFNGLIDLLKNQFWLRETQNILNRDLSGNLTYEELVTRSVRSISRAVDACCGALYSFDSGRSVCELKASYAFVERDYLSNEFKAGEGIVGQVALEKLPILLKNIRREEAEARTGTLSEPPRNIYAVPLIYEKNLQGVLEIASFEEIGELKRKFMDDAAQSVATFLFTASQNQQIQELLDTTQKANEKLQNQATEMEVQAQELRAMNDVFHQQASELKEQNAELEAQRLQVEEADRLKSEFLSNMSHELRTPLNSVMALSRVLIIQAAEKLSEEEAKYLEIIERNGRHLLSLINDILDLSKIEAGRMEVNPKSFSPAAVVEEIIDSLESIADEKGIALVSNIPPDLPEIESDAARVHQILQNIIGNGVKFTQKGQVTVLAGNDAENVYISVQDTGIGISQEALPHIFDEFRQVDGSASRSFEGTGLGLTIAHKAAKILGGDISVESEAGTGTTFTVTLPIRWQEAASVSPPLHLAPFPERAQSRRPILVVDDEPGAAAIISGYLKDEGYQTLMATNGKEALKLAEAHRPHAITLDVIMPGMDGWELLQRLKSNPETAGIPVIMISMSDDRETGFALGAVGYIAKPVRKENLVSELHKIYGSEIHSVMIVDDDAIERNRMAEFVRQEGIDVMLAEDGRHCMELLDRAVPDILVLDLVMPRMDGFDVLEAIRSTPKTQNLPVIVVTAKDLSLQERQRLEGKVSAILTKGMMSPDQLRQRIRAFLTHVEPGPDLSGAHARKKGGRILVVEDNKTATVQIQNALKEIGLPVDVARNGHEALAYVDTVIPAGIVLDLMMPEMDGFEVLKTIRETPATSEIPVLVLTAKDLTPHELDQLNTNHIQHFVQKGDVDKQELLLKIRRMLGMTPDPELVFSGRLPPDEPGGTPDGQSLPPVKKSGSGRPVVLVIEDNPDNLITVRAILKGAYELSEACDGEAGLKRAFAEPPDLILLDMSLPKMHGFQVIEQLRKKQSTRQIPVVALTARAMKGDREKMLAAGCDDYISKPVDPETLLSTLEKWTKKR